MLQVTGCATAGGFAELSSERARLVELDARLEPFGRFPSKDVLARDAELVTFGFKTAEVDVERRDTIRGPEAVANWLDEWHARQLPAVDFVLGRDAFFLCRGAAVQEGGYPAVDPRDSGRTVYRTYRTRWVQDERGQWTIDRIWLDPGASARLGAIASGCRSGGDVARELSRVTVEAEVMFGGGPVGSTVMDVMSDAGWDLLDRVPYPMSEVSRQGGAVSVSYRLTPAWGVQGVLQQNPTVLTMGRLRNIAIEPRLFARERWIGLLASRTFSVVQLGAGPAVAMARWEWTDAVGWFERWDDVVENQTRIGAIGQVAVVFPVASRVQPRLLARYTLTSDAEIPGYGGLDIVKVPLRRLTFGFGLSYFLR